MISKMKWTNKARIAVAVLSVALATAGLGIFLQTNQVAEASILTPLNFFDDFSGSLDQWESSAFGLWAIENEEYSGQNSGINYPTVAGSATWSDYVFQVRVDFKVGVDYAAHIRYQDPKNGYLLHIQAGSDTYRSITFLRRVAGINTVLLRYTFPSQIPLNTWHTIRIEAKGYDFKVYWNGVLRVETTDPTGSFATGKIGLGVHSPEHAHFDEVSVWGAEATKVPSIYNVYVRTGTTVIVITCTWSGSGNSTMRLVSPTATYYESDMGMYEKAKVSVDGTTTNILNIKRAALSIVAPTSSETWVLYLNLNDVTTYQVNVEIS